MKNDRRVRKTKKAIQEGLAQLMLEKDLRHITVQAVSDQADIHRATFYSHYADVYDLYTQMEDGAISEITQAIEADPTQSCEDMYRVIINYVYDNANMCRLFLDARRSMGFINRLSTLLEERFALLLFADRPQGTPSLETCKYYASYHFQGILAMLNRWAKDNFAHPKEDIIRMVTAVDEHFDKI